MTPIQNHQHGDRLLDEQIHRYVVCQRAITALLSPKLPPTTKAVAPRHRQHDQQPDLGRLAAEKVCRNMAGQKRGKSCGPSQAPVLHMRQGFKATQRVMFFLTNTNRLTAFSKNVQYCSGAALLQAFYPPSCKWIRSVDRNWIYPYPVLVVITNGVD